MSMLGLDIVVEGARREVDDSILRQHLYAIMPGKDGQLDAEVRDAGLSRRGLQKCNPERDSKVLSDACDVSAQRTLQGARAARTVLAGSDADPTPVILSNSDLLQSSVVVSFACWAARMIYGCYLPSANFLNIHC
jgi:hypothetical protein